MKKMLKLATVAALLAIILPLAVAACGPTPGAASQGTLGMPAAQGQPYGMGPMNGKGAGPIDLKPWGGPENSLVAVAARVLGMSQAELVAQLANKTLAQVAQEKGITTDKIVDAFLAPRAAMLKTAVEAGLLTKVQADQMLSTMRVQVTTQLNTKWTPSGPGTGIGFVDANTDGISDTWGLGTGPHGRWTR